MNVELGRQLADQLAQRDDPLVQLDRPGLQARHAQQILNDLRQMVGLAVDCLHELALLVRRELARQQQLGVAEDRRERRAQLVRDDRDELGLQPVGLALAGDIAHHPQPAGQAPQAVARRRREHLELLERFAQHDRRCLDLVGLALPSRAEIGQPQWVGQARQQHRHQIPGHMEVFVQLDRAEPPHAQPGRVVAQDAALAVEQRQAAGDARKHLAELRARLEQLLVAQRTAQRLRRAGAQRLREGHLAIAEGR